MVGANSHGLAIATAISSPVVQGIARCGSSSILVGSGARPSYEAGQTCGRANAGQAEVRRGLCGTTGYIPWMKKFNSERVVLKLPERSATFDAFEMYNCGVTTGCLSRRVIR